MTLVLDRFFGHRLRMVTGKDCNPLNRVEVICDSMMNNDGILRGSKVIKLVPEQTITTPNVGDPIRLSRKDFAHLSSDFFTEIEQEFRDDSAWGPWPLWPPGSAVTSPQL